MQPRKSRTINLLLLGGGMLAFSMCLCSGCGRHDQPEVHAPYDPQWHDAQGQPIAKEWKLDEEGRRTPAQTAYDANGKPIQFDANGNPLSPAGTTYSSSGSSHGSSYHHSGGGWLFPYILSSRATSNYGPAYRSGPRNAGSTYFGGSKPNSSSPSAAGSHPSGGSSTGSGSVSHGGFGGGAAAHSSSSAS